jgi:AcrR family transcriptional regulator
MGIRPPSVYVHFPSKHPLYDALFARGARLLLEAMREVLEAMREEVIAAPPARRPWRRSCYRARAPSCAGQSSMPPTRSCCSGARCRVAGSAAGR